MESSPAPDRRFVLVVAASAGRVTLRQLRSVLRHPHLAGRGRVETVTSVDDAARRLRLQPDTVPVAAGGDGTANLLAFTLRRDGEAPLMGILPLGTGNALAHALGLGRLPAALAALHGGAPLGLDVMVTTHPAAPLALASLSAGFEGRFLRRYAGWRHLGRGLAGLAAAVVEHGVARGPLRLLADGEDLTRGLEGAWNAGLYNIPCYAGGRTIWPDAHPDDGWAEAVVSATRRRYWTTLVRGLRTAAPPADAERRYRRCRAATMCSPGPIQFDGEWAPGGEFEVQLVARGLRVLAPPARSAG